MHNGFLQVEGEKMSKSLGNFVTIHELLHTDRFGARAWPGATLRFAMLRTHYRQPIDWTAKALEDADRALDEWGRVASGVAPSNPTTEFVEALCDDLNFAKAEAHLHGLKRADPAALAANVQLIGLDLPTYITDRFVASGSTIVTAERIDELIAARLAARAAKNWAESDRIRDELAGMGVALKDNKDGTTTWEAKR
jgi:cysteinyl-tRNA synthetase